MQGVPRCRLPRFQRRFLSAPADRSSSCLTNPAGLFKSALPQPLAPALTFMTSDHPGRSQPAQLPELVAGEQQSMHQDLDYRLLESSYRQSAEYAAMVERYPLLRSWITACESSELVGHPPSMGDAVQAA